METTTEFGNSLRKKFWKQGREFISFMLLTYPVGILLGVLFNLLRLIRFIRVRHPERFPHGRGRIVVYANHHSYYGEAFTLPALFFRDYLFHPWRRGPWSTPDKANFIDKPFFFWLRPRAIPVPRGNKQKENNFLLRCIKAVYEGGNLILFPEGGRTSSGKEHLFSPSGKPIRPFKGGLPLLIKAIPEAAIVPVWLENFDRVLPDKPDRRGSIFPRFWKGPIIIKIGQPLGFGKEEESGAMKCRLEQALLELADEVSTE